MKWLFVLLVGFLCCVNVVMCTQSKESYGARLDRISEVSYEMGRINAYKDILLYLRYHPNATIEDVRIEINRLYNDVGKE